MTLLEETLRSFGSVIGIPNLAFNAYGSICFSLENVGDVYFQKSNDEGVLIGMTGHLPVYQNELYLKALDLCHFRHQHPVDVQVGMTSDERLVFLTLVNANDFTLEKIESVLRLFEELYQEI